MKKIYLILSTLAAVFFMVLAVSCGKKEKEVKSEGVYYQINISNKADTGALEENYKLELFSDGSYILNYNTRWSVHLAALNYGRDLTSYGTYETTATEEGSKTVKLSAPERIQFVWFHRNQTKLVVDTNNWPTYEEDGVVKNGFEYTYFERAETETWENKEDFIKAYGREYSMKLDLATGSMIVTVNGTQIPSQAAVTK